MPARQRKNNFISIVRILLLCIVAVATLLLCRRYVLSHKLAPDLHDIINGSTEKSDISKLEAINEAENCIQQTLPKGAVVTVDRDSDNTVQVDNFNFLVKGSFTISGEMFETTQRHSFTCKVTFDKLRQAACDDLVVK